MGAYVENAQRVRLENVVLRAAPGEDGADGEEATEAAADGPDGLVGTDACSASPNPGPVAVNNTDCAQAFFGGGGGGDGGLASGDGGNGDWFCVGCGGQGQTLAGWSCEPGIGSGVDQVAGFDANSGAGARGFGALLAGRFSGFSGQRGGSGGGGRGGPGGGGARAPASCSGLAQATGASGGGGGAGGCGGEGGEGGRPGGSSLALVTMNADVRMLGGALEYGDGGHGGDGAMGQLGGKGGGGGDGGKGSGGSSDACPGARGGDGGRGGPGGGGAGGHSIGVLYVGDAPRLRDVEGEAASVERVGGAGGAGPAEAGIDPAVQPAIVGREGVAAFIHAL
jgi:hypothetical protein